VERRLPDLFLPPTSAYTFSCLYRDSHEFASQLLRACSFWLAFLFFFLGGTSGFPPRPPAFFFLFLDGLSFPPPFAQAFVSWRFEGRGHIHGIQPWPQLCFALKRNKFLFIFFRVVPRKNPIAYRAPDSLSLPPLLDQEDFLATIVYLLRPAFYEERHV